MKDIRTTGSLVVKAFGSELNMKRYQDVSGPNVKVCQGENVKMCGMIIFSSENGIDARFCFVLYIYHHFIVHAFNRYL